MSNKKNNPEHEELQDNLEELETEVNDPGNPGEPDSVGGQGEPDSTGPAPDQPADPQVQIDALNDKLLRSMADYQNLARRSQISVQQARQEALADLGKAMITALDHFDQALQVDPETVTGQTVLDGITMVRDELHRTLGQFEIKQIDPQPGEEFDPNRHEALLRTEPPADSDITSGYIVQTLKPGYAIADRVIRPAQVSLAN